MDKFSYLVASLAVVHTFWRRYLLCHFFFFSFFKNSPKFEQVTRLPNKIRVATEAVPGHFSGIGIFIDAGSRYEDASLRGVSHIIDRLAFKVWVQFEAFLSI